MKLNSTIIIAIIVFFIMILLFVGTPVKPMRLIGQGIVKIGIGVLFLFFINVFGGVIGLHIPINLFTAVIAGFLGIFGVASLAAIHLFIF